MSFLKRSGIQLAEPFSERRLLNQGRYRSTWTPPYILQNKLNGERCRAIVQDSRCLLLSSTEHIISSVPNINQACLHLPNGEYDGELYVHGWTFSEIASVISSFNDLHPRHAEMQYHIFDLVNEKSQLDRLAELTSILPNSYGPLHRVQAGVAYDMEGIMAFYDKAISDGYEGFIIRQIDSLYSRKRSQLMMKFKPKCKDTYSVLTVNEAIAEDGTRKNMVGSFTCFDDMGTEFRVGAGKLPHPRRVEIWQQYQDGALNVGIFGNVKLEIEYQTMSDKNKVPHFSRAVDLIDKEVTDATKNQR